VSLSGAPNRAHRQLLGTLVLAFVPSRAARPSFQRTSPASASTARLSSASPFNAALTLKPFDGLSVVTAKGEPLARWVLRSTFWGANDDPYPQFICRNYPVRAAPVEVLPQTDG